MKTARDSLILTALLLAVPALGATAEEQLTAVVEAPASANPGARAAAALQPIHGGTASIGAPRRLRLGLTGDYFRASNVLVQGDDDERLRGSLSVAYAPTGWLDLYGALLASGNRNRRTEATGRRDPETLIAVGDLLAGAKAVRRFGPHLSLGLDGGLKVLTTQGALGYNLGASSAWIGPAATMELEALRASLAADFYLDRSSAAIQQTTDTHTRYVVNFANDVGRSRLRLRGTVDHLLSRWAGVELLPYLQYHLDLVTASPDATLSQCTGCTSNRDQQGVILGLRAQLSAQVGLDLAADLRLRPIGATFGSPQAPYALLAGITFIPGAGSAREPGAVPVRERVVKVEIPAPVTSGTLLGTVKTAPLGKPVADAVVTLVGQKHGRVLTDPDGSFRLVGLPPGPVLLDVKGDTFEQARAEAVVRAGQETTSAIVVTPRAPLGEVKGQVVGKESRPVAATLRFSGASTLEARADATGSFSVRVPPGRYDVRIEAEGHLSRQYSLEVTSSEPRSLEAALPARPAAGNVKLGPRGLVLRTPVLFQGRTPALAPRSQALLDEVADFLLGHPELRKLRIEARWDLSLGQAAALELTRTQAETVRTYLVSAGVEGGRLEAVGLGAARPAAAGNRVLQILRSAQPSNRRVELVFAP